MKFPVTVTYRKASAVIYGKTAAYPFYRVAWRAAGKRFLLNFSSYSEAHKAAKAKAKELSKGNQTVALTPKEAASALAVRDVLAAYHKDTGRTVTPLQAVSAYVEAMKLLPAGHSLADAVKGFLQTVVSVKRVDVKEAMEAFLKSREARTVAADGKRPQLSPEHFRNTGYCLREFAATFPSHAVCDLSKEHLRLYMATHSKSAPKTRNERRGVIKMFLQWCVEQDFLAPTHRLGESSDLKHEIADTGEVEFYKPAELRLLLTHAPADLLPVLALAGLAGLREKEILRLTWEDVFSMPGHVEIKAVKAKTRARRLVPIGSALSAWLEPYRGRTGLLWAKSYQKFHEEFAALRESEAVKVAHKRNGLRHAYATYSFALDGNENTLAAAMGNSPQMIHSHYKGLATRKEGEAWFAVAPVQAPNVVLLASGTDTQPAN